MASSTATARDAGVRDGNAGPRARTAKDGCLWQGVENAPGRSASVGSLPTTTPQYRRFGNSHTATPSFDKISPHLLMGPLILRPLGSSQQTPCCLANPRPKRGRSLGLVRTPIPGQRCPLSPLAHPCRPHALRQLARLRPASASSLLSGRCAVGAPKFFAAPLTGRRAQQRERCCMAGVIWSLRDCSAGRLAWKQRDQGRRARFSADERYASTPRYDVDWGYCS